MNMPEWAKWVVSVIVGMSGMAIAVAVIAVGYRYPVFILIVGGIAVTLVAALIVRMTLFKE